ncbi:DUF3857 domain-containing protein [Chitinophaga silvatica]|uniref:DUF3857 domain-containing protein n=1 Tax=Chitinophaga silvatica TaxID=2282649 RepID=A0A3E1YG96_9BACT|nr:DUF3857 domain-containing protein [Chitinophaga silvatica]RFS26421.1 DUF3857 domain-containing protein [Chitinophaga silvatica]
MSLFFRVICCLIFLLPNFVAASGPNYAVADIPLNLRQNANVVVRLDELEVQIRSLSDMRKTHHYVITILNEEGAEAAEFIVGYDKLSSIRSISGVLYDEYGAQVKRLKNSEIKDYSAVDNSSLMTDNRVKVHSFYYNSYPYTVEYTIEQSSVVTLFLPVWRPQKGYNCSLQHAKLSVETPKDFVLNYKEYLIKDKPQITQNKSTTNYLWELNDIPATKSEYFTSKHYQLLPTVYFGAKEFEYGGIKGDLSSWKTFGDFFYKLDKGRDVLPANIKATVHKLVDGQTDSKEKIKILYEYLQKNYRYIGVQIGVGGMQSMDAESVANKGYGDCKALTNYMMAMLKEVGIPSNPVNIKAGAGDYTIREDFPSWQFNHVILCVPQGNDTTWLECTSQSLPVNYLGEFTDNRYALFIDENNSKLIRTPTYGLKDNLKIRNIDATINEEGDATLKASTLYTGLQQDDLSDRLHALSKEKQLDYLRKNLSFSSYDVTGFEYRELPALIPAIQENLTIQANNYASVTGKRIFIAPNLLSQTNYNLSKNESRKSTIEIKISYREADTVHINLPVGYVPESMPGNVDLSTKFGKYSNQYIVTNNKLVMIRNRENYAGEYPPADYSALVEFYNAISQADKAKIVFVKK